MWRKYLCFICTAVLYHLSSTIFKSEVCTLFIQIKYLFMFKKTSKHSNKMSTKCQYTAEISFLLLCFNQKLISTLKIMNFFFIAIATALNYSDFAIYINVDDLQEMTTIKFKMDLIQCPSISVEPNKTDDS